MKEENKTPAPSVIKKSLRLEGFSCLKIVLLNELSAVIHFQSGITALKCRVSEIRNRNFTGGLIICMIEICSIFIRIQKN